VFTLLLNCFLNFEQGLRRANTGNVEPSQPNLLQQDPAAEFLVTQQLKLDAVFDILHKPSLNSSKTSSPSEPLLVWTLPSGPRELMAQGAQFKSPFYP